MASEVVEPPRQPPSPEEGTLLTEEALDELPPSARKVYGVLQDAGPLTHKDLLQVTEMPGRTVRYAISRLKDAGVIGWQCSLMDCRQCFFYVSDRCAGKEEYRKVRSS